MGRVLQTMLFTDIVESTRHLGKLGDAGWTELLRRHHEALRGALQDHHGREVDCAGDGFLASFEAPADAVRAAAHAVRQVSLLGLQIRAGLHTSEVEIVGGRPTGIGVHVAARIMALAGPGEVLISSTLRDVLIGSGIRFTDHGMHELKGLPDPWHVFSLDFEHLPSDPEQCSEPECNDPSDGRRPPWVAWLPQHGRARELASTHDPASPRDDDTNPFPARLIQEPAIPLVGRRFEREALEAAFKAVSAGNGHRAVLVGGEAGIGKTTLVADMARTCHRHGTTVLYGRCDESLAIPYQPFVEAVGQYLGQAPDRWLQLHDRRHLSDLTRLVPVARDRRDDLPDPVSTDPDAERWLLFGAVATLLAEASAHAPVILVLDDLHWADRPTLNLLRYLVSTPLGRVLTVGSYRHNELSVANPMTETLGLLRREHNVERLTLAGLDDAEVAAFITAQAGHDLDEAGAGLARAIYRETDGNPFFVSELLRHLVETGVVYKRPDGRWSGEDVEFTSLPESIREVVGARVARLGSAAHRLLAAAAVIGQELDLEVLCLTAELDEDQALDLLEEAERAALVTESPGTPGRFRFAHALIQHTLYADLGATRQARWHQRVAEALEGLSSDGGGERVTQMARHFLAATRPADRQKAVAYAQLAGDRALGALAPDEAVRWYSQALAALAPGQATTERVGCLVGLGDAQRQSGDPNFRQTLLNAAHLASELGDTEMLVHAALANNRGFFSAAGKVDDERVAVLEEALALVTGEVPERALLLSRLSSELTYHPDAQRRIALVDESVAVARACGDIAALVQALVHPVNNTLMVPELRDRRFEYVSEAAELILRLDDPVSQFWTFLRLAVVMVERAAIDRADEALARADRIATTVGQPTLTWACAYTRSWRALLVGEVEQAERLAAEAVSLGRSTAQPDADAVYFSQLLFIRSHQGRVSEILPLFARVIAKNPGIPAFAGMCAAATAVSDRTSSLELMEVARPNGFQLPHDMMWLAGTYGWAEAAAELGDIGAADTLYRRLAPWHDHIPIGGVTVNRCVAHVLGQLAVVLQLPDEADAHFAEAMAIHERLRAPFYIAQTKLAWGRHLLARDPARALVLLHQAADLSEVHGYRHISGAVASLLP